MCQAPRSLTTIFTAALAVATIGLRAPAAADVIITEILAASGSGLRDADGEVRDWFELYNTGPDAVDLGGWSVTDNPDVLDKWVFEPGTVIGAGQFLTIFASGKDRRDPTRELHTNFRLDGAGGESLLLITPDPAIAWIFRDLPNQVPDVSYGYESTFDSATEIPRGAAIKWIVPDDEIDGWTGADFDASAWGDGIGPIGFDREEEPLYADRIRTDIGDAMHTINSTAFLRIEFTADAADLERLFELDVEYDDGFVLYLNGEEIAARNALTSRSYNTRSASARPSDQVLVTETVRLATSGRLREGRNVLAVQLLNRVRSDDDAYFDFELRSFRVTGIDIGAPMFFESPSPSWPNSGGKPGVAPAPAFSRESGAVSEAIDLTISSELAGATIRYTTDGTTPSVASADYDTPIPITTTTVVKARVFHADLVASAAETKSYLFLHPNVAGFDSNLPLVIINTFGQTVAGCSSSVKTRMHVHIIEPGEDGRARITDVPVYSGAGGVKQRGASTCGRQKFSMNFEILDEFGEDTDIRFLDWGPESDYILYGAYNFDHALMRNVLAYELSNQAGQWASKTQYVEVYVNTGRGPVSTANFMGLYSVVEKIKPGSGRLDIGRLRPQENEEPEISSGYVFKRDRNQQGEPTVPAPGACNGSDVVVEYPKTMTAEQRAYLTRILADMNRLLSAADSLGSARPLIDVPSWIDHHILNVMPKNVDAFRLSGFSYVYQGKVHRGPAWDYDRSMGSTDGRDSNPLGWANSGGDGGTQYFSCGWYGQLFKHGPINVTGAGRPPLGNDEWARLYRERWRELREDALSTENILAVVDGFADESAEAWLRNWQKWRQGSTQAAAISTLKNWLQQRVAWIDSEFIEPPLISPPGGDYDAPTSVTIEADGGTPWYTINGPDPMAANGNAAPEAMPYSAAITVDRNTRIWTRLRVGTRTWSEPVVEVYVFERMPLVITEIMYNPVVPKTGPGAGARTSDLEFVELQNAGNETLDLTAVRFNDPRFRFDFTGSGVTSLEPGAFALIVGDVEVFEAVYGPGLPIAGEITTALSNASGVMSLVGPVDEDLLDFRYDDDWVPETDGGGYSLVIKDPLGARELWSEGTSWRASLEAGGSPGRADGPAASGRRVQGDVNGDLRVNVTDAVGLLGHLFRGSPADLPCGSGTLADPGNFALLNVDGDDEVTLTDGVFLLRYLFLEGPPPALGVGCTEIEACDERCSN